MLPEFSIDDQANGHLSNTQVSGNFRLSVFARCLHIEYLVDLFRFQLASLFAAQNFLWLGSGTVSISSWASPLVGHVCGIVLRRSCKQMVGIATRRIVTLVEYIHPIWNASIGKDIGHTVSADAFLSDVPKVTIATWFFACLPFPAFVGQANCDLIPESCFEGYTAHVVALLQRVAAMPQAVCAALGFLRVPIIASDSLK